MPAARGEIRSAMIDNVVTMTMVMTILRMIIAGI